MTNCFLCKFIGKKSKKKNGDKYKKYFPKYFLPDVMIKVECKKCSDEADPKRSECRSVGFEGNHDINEPNNCEKQREPEKFFEVIHPMARFGEPTDCAWENGGDQKGQR